MRAYRIGYAYADPHDAGYDASGEVVVVAASPADAVRAFHDDHSERSHSVEYVALAEEGA